MFKKDNKYQIGKKSMVFIPIGEGMKLYFYAIIIGIGGKSVKVRIINSRWKDYPVGMEMCINKENCWAEDKEIKILTLFDQ